MAKETIEVNASSLEIDINGHKIKGWANEEIQVDANGSEFLAILLPVKPESKTGKSITRNLQHSKDFRREICYACGNSHLIVVLDASRLIEQERES